MMIVAAQPPAAAPGDSSPDRYFVADGARLRYRDEGHGPAVLLIHGWTLDLAMWDALAAALAGAFRVVRLDRRGFGLSGGMPSSAGDAADLEALCRHLGLGRVAVVGMSQGARAALALAAAHPDRVACLVLDGPPDLGSGRVRAGDEVPLGRLRRLYRTRGIDAVRAEWLRHPLMRLRTRDPAAHRQLAAIVARYPGRDLALDLPAAAERPSCAAIRAPVLVVTGEYDAPARRHAADALAARLPSATRAVVPAAGHLPNLDNPAVYHQLVRAFLDQHAALH